jgi:opacity protein-like surface antigen
MKYALIGLAVSLLLGASAQAADLYRQEAPPQPYYAPEPVAAAGGWYLRGDGIYGFNTLRGANYFQGSNALLADFKTGSVDGSFGLGGGVGYQISSMLRTDLTADYMFSSNFKGSTVGGGSGGGACATACTSTDLSSYTALSIMANAYVDLGTYYSVTPYVGGGIGGTNINWNSLRNTSCNDGSGACDATVEHDGKSSWRFTYALMAGAAVDVTCNLKADVGYRFRQVSGGDMFGYKLNGGPGYDKGFNIHEARVGLRYTLGGCAEPAPVYAPPPAIYK